MSILFLINIENSPKFSGIKLYFAAICFSAFRKPSLTVRDCGANNRNHCPHCLSSIHLDNIPGDRSADCGGIMEPISIYVRPDGEWALIHRCKKCGELKINRIAADDNEYLLLSLACKPLANPPFPLSALSSHFGKEDK